jgi:hypothetical protein
MLSTELKVEWQSLAIIANREAAKKVAANSKSCSKEKEKRSKVNNCYQLKK